MCAEAAEEPKVRLCRGHGRGHAVMQQCSYCMRRAVWVLCANPGPLPVHVSAALPSACARRRVCTQACSDAFPHVLYTRMANPACFFATAVGLRLRLRLRSSAAAGGIAGNKSQGRQAREKGQRKTPAREKDAVGEERVAEGVKVRLRLNPNPWRHEPSTGHASSFLLSPHPHWTATARAAAEARLPSQFTQQSVNRCRLLHCSGREPRTL